MSDKPDTKLSKKANRLYGYLVNGGSTNIGDICEELKTTPHTLMSETFPEVLRFCQAKTEREWTE